MDDIKFMMQASKDWRTALEIQARCKHLNLFIGPPGSGKSTVLKYLLGDTSKLSVITNNGKFSIVDTENCLAHLDTYSTSTVRPMIAKGDELFVECPDLHNIQLVTSFFLERLLRITRTVRIVFVCDYQTVTDKANNYSVFWSHLVQVGKLMTNSETITNVGLIVTKTSAYTEEQMILYSLGLAFLDTTRINCSNSVMTSLESETQHLYYKTSKMIGYFEPLNVVLFKTPVQAGPMNQSRLFANNKVWEKVESIEKSETKDFSFAFGVNGLKPNELRAMTERCHYATLKGLDNRINNFLHTRLLECTKDTLDDVRILILRTLDYLVKLYTGRKLSEDVELLIAYPSDDQQFHAYKQFFVVEILEFHRILMRFFKRDYDMTMQGIVYGTVDKKLHKVLELFPKWEQALGVMETVGKVLSNDEYQTKRHLYNRKDLGDWGKVNIHAQHGLIITAENFGSFCKRISCHFKLDDLEEPFGLACLNNIVAERLHDPFLKFIDIDVAKIRGKEVVLVFGNAGVGKTTLIQHLSGRKRSLTVKHPITRYPNIVKINDVFYIDCPSLDEVRRYENELQIWITIKTILKISKGVKWLKVAEAGDLKITGRENLQKFLQSFVAFMRNFEKYGDGLGLVMTKIKCPDYHSARCPPETDVRKILSQITVDRPFDTKIKRLTEILLAKKSGNDSKIICFFRFDTNPSFEALCEHEKKQLQKMIDHLSFIQSDENDFGYTLSNKAKIQIISILIGNHLETHFQNCLGAPSCDIVDVNATVDSIVESLKAIRDEHLEIDDSCASYVSEFLNKLFTNHQIDKRIIGETMELVSAADGSAALNVIANMSNNLAQRRHVMFNFGFRAIEKYLCCVQRFTKFFIKLHEALSSYVVQSRKSAYQVVVATTTTPSNDNFIDHRNCKQRLEEITGLKDFKDDEFQLVDDVQKRHFYQLLSFAVTSKIQELETFDEIRIKGNYILTEKLPREVLESAKPLFLFATNTIFIDQPMSQGVRKVFVIAPTIDLRISAAEVDTVFFVTQNFKDFGRSMCHLFGAYKTRRVDEMNLLYRYDVCSKTCLDDYIAFVTRNQANTAFQEKNLWKFIEFIESKHDELMRDMHGGDHKNDQYQPVKNLIRHFQYLETLTGQLSDSQELVPRFRDLAKQVERQFNTDPATRTILSHLYVALTTKVQSLENDRCQQLILDAKQFLEALRSNIDQYNRASAAQEIRRIQVEFKHSVREKMSEGSTFIETQLVRKIDSLYATIDKNIEKLLAEVSEEQTKADSVRQELHKKLDTYKQKILMRNIFTTLRGVTTALGAFGVITDKLAKVLDSSINVTEAIALPITRIHEMPKYELPHSVKDAIRLQDDKLANIHFKDLEALINHMDDFFQVVDKLPNKNDKIAAEITRMRDDLFEFKLEEQHLHDSLKYVRACRIAKAAGELTKDLGKLLQPEHLQQMEILGRSLNHWTGQMHLLEELHLVREHLMGVESDMEKLQVFHEKINKTMIPVLNDIQSAYTSCQKDVAGLSEIGLDVKTWQMQSAFVQFKNFCATFTDGFHMHDHMMDCLGQMEAGLNVLLTVHRRFHEYRNREEILECHGRMTGATDNVSDSEVVNQLYFDLSMSINESIILEQYKKGLNGFRQWAFPFAKVYLSDLTLALQQSGSAPEQRFKALTVQAIANVQQIIDRTMQHNSSVVSVRDSCVLESQFDGGALTPVFYAWRSDDCQDDIRRILKGEEVQLTADIRLGVAFDAVKFSKIRLEFCARHPSEQITIDSFLKKAQIRLVHSGQSVYKFDNRNFLITTEAVAIQYSYACQRDGEPCIRNEVYNKLAQSKPVLSPYTGWRVQVTGIVEPWLGPELQVDLRLSGFGQYAKVGGDVDLEVEKNYQSYVC